MYGSLVKLFLKGDNFPRCFLQNKDTSENFGQKLRVTFEITTLIVINDADWQIIVWQDLIVIIFAMFLWVKHYNLLPFYQQVVYQNKKVFIISQIKKLPTNRPVNNNFPSWNPWLYLQILDSDIVILDLAYIIQK